MAKKVDQFEKFRAATLGRSSELGDVLASSNAESNTSNNQSSSPAVQVVEKATPETVPAPVQTVTPEKVSKNADRELVSFHISKDRKKLLGLLKFESDRSYGDLYNEAIDDLLRKYGRL